MKLILLLIIFLNSCVTLPTIEPKERCVIVLPKNEIAGYCRCQFYYWSIDQISKIGEPKDYALDKCDNLVGFNFKDTGEIYQFQEKIRLYLKASNK